MSTPLISAHGLRKVYRNRRGRRVFAVDGLDLEVPRGGVHGFLGPNGSGKTTTIRMLLGLASASAGEMRIFGERVPDRLPQVLPRIGAVVEQPKFTPMFTGRRNLLLLAGAAGIDSSRVDRVIEVVGLGDRARDHYSTYSLGMRHRLAIAATLIKQPELLILDEPTNGLDPGGIREVRELIGSLAADGVTVLLSSHILAEVQQLCESVSIIDHGRLIASGSVDSLLGEATAQTRVRVADPESALEVLVAEGYTVGRSLGDLLVQGHEHPEEISQVLGQRGIWVHDLTAVRPNLETVFLRLTREHAEEEAG